MDARFVRTVVAVSHAKVAMEVASSVLVYFLQDLRSLIMILLTNGGAHYATDILVDESSHNTKNSSFMWVKGRHQARTLLANLSS